MSWRNFFSSSSEEPHKLPWTDLSDFSKKPFEALQELKCHEIWWHINDFRWPSWVKSLFFFFISKCAEWESAHLIVKTESQKNTRQRSGKNLSQEPNGAVRNIVPLVCESYRERERETLGQTNSLTVWRNCFETLVCQTQSSLSFKVHYHQATVSY